MTEWLCAYCSHYEGWTRWTNTRVEGRFAPFNRMTGRVGALPDGGFGLWEAARLLSGHPGIAPPADAHRLVAVVLGRHGIKACVHPRGGHTHLAVSFDAEQMTGPYARAWCDLVEQVVLGIPDMLTREPERVEALGPAMRGYR